jgi:hypothetical protein
MTPIKVCSICNSAIVGFGNIAEPIRTGRCCDRCYIGKRSFPNGCDGC